MESLFERFAQCIPPLVELLQPLVDGGSLHDLLPQFEPRRLISRNTIREELARRVARQANVVEWTEAISAGDGDGKRVARRVGEHLSEATAVNLACYEDEREERCLIRVTRADRTRQVFAVE